MWISRGSMLSQPGASSSSSICSASQSSGSDDLPWLTRVSSVQRNCAASIRAFLLRIRQAPLCSSRTISESTNSGQPKGRLGTALPHGRKIERCYFCFDAPDSEQVLALANVSDEARGYDRQK